MVSCINILFEEFIFIFGYQTFKTNNMKKLNKEKLKTIVAGGEICLECAIGYYQVIIDGKCYCIPWE